MPNFGIIASSNSSSYWADLIRNPDDYGYQPSGKIGVDSDGNIYFCIDVNDLTDIIKVDPSGTIVWAKTLNGKYNPSQFFWHVTVHSNNDIFINWNDTISRPYGNYRYNGIIKLNTSGNIIWQKQYAGTLGSGGSNDVVNTVSVVKPDSSGNLYNVGQYQPMSGAATGFLTKLDSSGTVQWTKNISGLTFDGFTNAYYNDLSVASSGNIYAGGSFSNGSGGSKGLLVKYNSSGTVQWQKQINDPAASGAGERLNIDLVATDSSENIYIFATIYTTNTIPGNGIHGILMKFNSSGTLLWQRQYINNTNALNRRISMFLDSTDSNVYIVSDDIIGPYVLKYNSSGTFQWQRQFDGAGTNIYYTFANRNSDNNVIFVYKYEYTDTIDSITKERIILIRMPSDGSRTGTISYEGLDPIEYKVMTTITDAAGSFTDGTPTLTTGTLTVTGTSASLSLSNDTQFTGVRVKL